MLTLSHLFSNIDFMNCRSLQESILMQGLPIDLPAPTYNDLLLTIHSRTSALSLASSTMYIEAINLLMNECGAVYLTIDIPNEDDMAIVRTSMLGFAHPELGINLFIDTHTLDITELSEESLYIIQEFAGIPYNETYGIDAWLHNCLGSIQANIQDIILADFSEFDMDANIHPFDAIIDFIHDAL